MKCIALVGGVVLTLSSLLQAAQMPPAPIPEGPVGDGAVLSASAPVELYHCVKYKDERNIHPCAVPLIVAVPDPCADPCDCSGPRCVYVKICVPPCECAQIKCRRNGTKITYDFGKYEVDITSRRGMVVVDYDD
jgi:hypothetical protein